MAEPAAAEPINPENNHLPNEPIVNNRPRNNNANANNNNNTNNANQQPVRFSLNWRHSYLFMTPFWILESAYQYQRQTFPCAVLQDGTLVLSVGSSIDPTNDRVHYADESACSILHLGVHSHQLLTDPCDLPRTSEDWRLAEGWNFACWDSTTWWNKSAHERGRRRHVWGVDNAKK